MSWNTAALVAILAVAPPQAGSRASITPPVVPQNLQVPAGFKPFLIARAAGTQNYMCLASGSDIKWTFQGPQATLFNDEDEQVMTHFLSANPIENGTLRATWQHSRDTSAIWAVAIADSSDPAFVEPGAISWLLLRVVGAQYGPTWGDKVMRTAFIQRVNASGGSAPASGCSLATIGQRALVPYTTDYVFYR